MAGKYTDDQYKRFDPFEGDRDVKIKCRTIAIVKVRKEHICYDGMWSHEPRMIKVGERARYETALVDGNWGRYYICLPCIDRWFKECGIEPALDKKG